MMLDEASGCVEVLPEAVADERHSTTPYLMRDLPIVDGEQGSVKRQRAAKTRHTESSKNGAVDRALAVFRRANERTSELAGAGDFCFCAQKKPFRFERLS
ncbi:hypothetical protein N9189_01600 [Pirellulaceae bacterium]|nr:hypothetical protein [Pirellulaceae bacterium]